MEEKNNSDVLSEDEDKDLAESKIYEIGYHIVPLVAQDNVPAEATKLKFEIEKHKGTIISEETPKLRVLAYEIPKMVSGNKHNFDKAYFGWIKFEALGDAIGKIKEFLEHEENILRFLLIKTVRESTLAPMQRIVTSMRAERDRAPREALKEKVDKKPASVEEIDKSIEKLLQ